MSGRRDSIALVSVGEPRRCVRKRPRICGIVADLSDPFVLLARDSAIPNRGIGESASVRTLAETRGLNLGTSCRSGTSTGFVRSLVCGIIRLLLPLPNRIPLWDGPNRDSATLPDSLYTAMTSHDDAGVQRLIRGDTHVPI